MDRDLSDVVQPSRSWSIQSSAEKRSHHRHIIYPCANPKRFTYGRCITCRLSLVFCRSLADTPWLRTRTYNNSTKKHYQYQVKQHTAVVALGSLALGLGGRKHVATWNKRASQIPGNSKRVKKNNNTWVPWYLVYKSRTIT